MQYRIVFILFSIIFIFGACKEKNNMVIRIGVLNGPTAISAIKLMDKSVTMQGMKIEIIIKDDPLQIQALMMRNKLDFAVLPTVMAANLFNRGVDFRMIACPVWGTLYILSNNEDIQSLLDFENRSVAVFAQGATPDILLQRELSKHNLKNVRLDYNYSSNHDIAQALLNNKVEIAIVSEPLVSALLSKKKSLHIVEQLQCEELFHSRFVDIFVQAAFVVNDKFVSEHQDLVQEVSNLYAASCNFVNEQPKDAARLLVAKALMPNEEIALSALPLCNIRYVGAFAIEREIQRYLQVFYEFNPKTTGGKTNLRKFIYR